MVLWGIGMGAQDSIMKAAVAEIIPPHKRGTSFGLFNTGFGVFWFLGSLAMGYLYDYSITALVAFSVTSQLIAFFLLWWLSGRAKALHHPK